MQWEAMDGGRGASGQRGYHTRPRVRAAKPHQLQLAVVPSLPWQAGVQAPVVSSPAAAAAVITLRPRLIRQKPSVPDLKTWVDGFLLLGLTLPLCAA